MSDQIFHGGKRGKHILSALLGQASVPFFTEIARALNRNHVATLFVSQVAYWMPRAADPDQFVYRTQEEWHEATVCREKEFRNAKKLLEKMNLLETKDIRVRRGNSFVNLAAYRINLESLYKLVMAQEIIQEDDSTPPNASFTESGETPLSSLQLNEGGEKTPGLPDSSLAKRQGGESGETPDSLIQTTTTKDYVHTSVVESETFPHSPSPLNLSSSLLHGVSDSTTGPRTSKEPPDPPFALSLEGGSESGSRTQTVAGSVHSSAEVPPRLTRSSLESLDLTRLRANHLKRTMPFPPSAAPLPAAGPDLEPRVEPQVAVTLPEMAQISIPEVKVEPSKGKAKASDSKGISKPTFSKAQRDPIFEAVRPFVAGGSDPRALAAVSGSEVSKIVNLLLTHDIPPVGVAECGAYIRDVCMRGMTPTVHFGSWQKYLSSYLTHQARSSEPKITPRGERVAATMPEEEVSKLSRLRGALS